MDVPALHSALLLSVREDLLRGRASKRAAALSFLVSDYKHNTFYWEVLECVRKVLLMALAIILPVGTLAQWTLALLLSLAFWIVLKDVRPFREERVNLVANVAHGSLVVTLLCAILLKHHNLLVLARGGGRGGVGQGEEQLLTTAHLEVALLSSNVLVVLLCCGAFLFKAREAWRLPLIRMANGQPPQLLLPGTDQYWHLFLSHEWQTGQDQVNNIKSSLQVMAPGLKCFLDVDDLSSIGELEVFVQQSGAVLCFLTDSYFQSRSCKREVKAALDRSKPLILVRETVPFHGGAPLQQIIDSCPEDLRAAVFAEGRPVIQWHRPHDFKLVSMRLIVQQLLVHGLAEGRRSVSQRAREGSAKLRDSLSNKRTEHRDRQDSSDRSSAATEAPLHINGEICRRHITLAPPQPPWSAHVHFSQWNPGVEDVIQCLQASVPGLVALEHTGEGHQVFGAADATSQHGTGSTTTVTTTTSLRQEPPHQTLEGVGSSGDIIAGADGNASHPSNAACFLIYLNQDTWTSSDTARLANQVRAALARGQKILMVTEKDELRGAMRIRDMVKQTPQDICEQLYGALAVPWFDGPHQLVCVKQLALEVQLASGGGKKSAVWSHWAAKQHLSIQRAANKPIWFSQVWSSRRSNNNVERPPVGMQEMSKVDESMI